MQNLIINEELKNLLPPLSATEFAGLEESILKDGCLSPLIVWKSTIVDGHNRYEICTKHQIPFAVKNVVLESLDDAKYWAWQHQENRRNLTDYHRGELALKLKEVIAARAKERQRAAGGDKSKGALPPTLAEAPSSKETRQELSQIAGISHGNLSKVEYITEHADEETKEKLRRGEKGTTINSEYNRLKAEEKAEQSASQADTSTANSNGIPAFGGKAQFEPGSEEELKYSSKTALKPIPRNRPDILVRNLITHFPPEFVPNMVRETFRILLEIEGKTATQPLAAEIYRQYGRK